MERATPIPSTEYLKRWSTPQRGSFLLLYHFLVGFLKAYVKNIGIKDNMIDSLVFLIKFWSSFIFLFMFLILKQMTDLSCSNVPVRQLRVLAGDYQVGNS